MLKKYSPIDILFFAFCVVFIALSAYEIVQFLIPLYTYARAMGVFILAFIMYFWYTIVSRPVAKNQWQESSDLPRKLRNSSDNFMIQSITSLYVYSKNHTQTLVYGAFILVAIVIHLWQIIDITVLTVYMILAFAALYLYAKILWFKLPMRVNKSSLRAYNTLRFFIILYAVFFVVVNYLLDAFLVPETDKMPIYLWASLAYLLSGYVIFFNYRSLVSAIKWFLAQKFLRPYPIAMGILILWLTGYLITKNNLIEQIEQWVELAAETQEETAGIVLPGIVSWEPVPEVTEPIEQENIEYETVSVGSAYNIETGLTLGSQWQSVVQLQTVLWNLQYFLWEVNGDFGEDTQQALIDALQTECAWPDTTRGIFGPLAKECIDGLLISRKIQSAQIQDSIQEDINTNS